MRLKPHSTEDLIAAIGSEYEEKAMMSTSASFKVSYGFTGDYGVMAIILASDDALNSLGTFCLDCFKGSQGNNGELELLLDAGARFKVLDVGTAEAEVWGEAWQIADGKLTAFCGRDESRSVPSSIY